LPDWTPYTVQQASLLCSEGDPLEIRAFRLNLLHVDTKALIGIASPADGYGQLTALGNREGGHIADLLHPVAPRLRAAVLIFDDLNIRWVNGEPMAPFEETAEAIFRSYPSEKPFNLPLFRPAQTAELLPLSVVEYQTCPRFEPECYGIPGEHLVELSHTTFKLVRRGELGERGVHPFTHHSLPGESEKFVGFLWTVEAPVTPAFQT
jgi:hypothetical protein